MFEIIKKEGRRAAGRADLCPWHRPDPCVHECWYPRRHQGGSIRPRPQGWKLAARLSCPIPTTCTCVQAMPW